MKGLFITVEGPDGAGKTTQLKLLAQELEMAGIEVVLTREPGGTEIGDHIRSLILDPAFAKMADMTEILLYAASRAQHVNELILPALDEGKIVLCDRFVDASVAYQGYGLGFPVETIEQVNAHATGGLVPDRTYLFDLTVEDAKKRMHARGALDRIEQRDDTFRQRVYDGFMAIAAEEPARVRRIDANREVEEIAEELRIDLLAFMKKRRDDDEDGNRDRSR